MSECPLCGGVDEVHSRHCDATEATFQPVKRSKPAYWGVKMTGAPAHKTSYSTWVNSRRAG